MKMPRIFKIKKRELNLLVLCCIIIIVSMSYVFIIEPFFKNYASIGEEIQQKQARFLRLRKVFLLKDSIEVSYEKLLPYFYQQASDEERFAFFLKEIERLSRQNNLYITALKPISVQSENNIGEYLIDMEAEGTIEALAAFFYNLPQSSQVISLKLLQINYLSRAEGGLHFKMNLSRMVVDVESE